MNVGSLFSGIGGFDLAARWMGWRTVWHSEIDEYACKVFARHFPESRNVGDVRNWQPTSADRVDIICGGFPCQPVSVAGKGLAQDDERWLWPHFARIVRVLRPRYVVVENVPGLLGRGMGDVLGDLAGVRYDAEWQSIPAAAVGAPHLRWRIWLVAYPNGEGEPWFAFNEQWKIPRPMENATSQRRRPKRTTKSRHTAGPRPFGKPTRSDWWAVEPDVGRVANGVLSRVDRLRCLGNAIVPQIAYWIFQQIEARERAA